MEAPLKRCIWCGSPEHIREIRFNSTDRVKTAFCSDKCETNARRFLAYDAKYSRSFLLAEFTLSFACLILIFLKLPFFAGFVAVVIGALMMPFPFLAAVLGGWTYIKRAILAVRLVSLLIVVGGLVAILLNPIW